MMIVLAQNPPGRGGGRGSRGGGRMGGGGGRMGGGAPGGRPGPGRGGMPIPTSSGGGAVPRGFRGPSGPRSAPAGGMGPGRRDGMGPHRGGTGPGFGRGRRRRHHRGHGAYPIYPWYPYWYYPYSYYYPSYAGYAQPDWYQPETCSPPISDDCSQLQPTARWATSCFLPRFRYLRNVYGDDYERLASALAREEAPWCAFPARSGAAAEYARRIKLAVAVLLNADGIPVRYPPAPPTPRPGDADSIQQPWMRALLTGWT